VLTATLVSGNQISFTLAAGHTAIFVLAAILLDRYRRSLKIEYKWDGEAQRIASALSESLGELGRCAALWSITSQGDTSDWKRNAGATKLIKRERTYIRPKKPACIRGVAKFPAIKLGPGKLFFLPDAALVVTSDSVAALHYADLDISNHSTHFVEAGTIPSDTKVVGETWRFVTKNGGPDRRFNFNKRLPVCLYGEMDVHSAGGLNGKIQFSNSTAGDRFAKLVGELAAAGLSNSKPVASFYKTNSLPSLIFCFLLFVTGAPLALANLSHRAPETLSSSSSVAREANIQGTISEIDKTSTNARPRNLDGSNRQAERGSASTGDSAIKPENNPTIALIDLAKPNDARRVQQRLTELGYLDGAADGKWGPRSRRALQDFRTAMAIGVDSTWDELTQQQLFSTSAKRFPAIPQIVSSDATLSDQQPSSCWIPTNEDIGVGYWGACSDKRSRQFR
jgi:hypothetical protein